MDKFNSNSNTDTNESYLKYQLLIINNRLNEIVKISSVLAQKVLVLQNRLNKLDSTEEDNTSVTAATTNTKRHLLITSSKLDLITPSLFRKVFGNQGSCTRKLGLNP